MAGAGHHDASTSTNTNTRTQSKIPGSRVSQQMATAAALAHVTSRDRNLKWKMVDDGMEQKKDEKAKNQKPMW